MQRSVRTTASAKGHDVLIASALASHGVDLSDSSDSTVDTSDESVSLQVKHLAQALDRGTCKLIRLLPTFDRHQGWARDGQRSCVAWLNTYCGMSLSTAHDRCRVAYALEELPVITQLFMLGELSWSKVRALTRIASPENERELASQALLMSASALEQMARQYRNVSTPDQAMADNEKASRQYQNRKVHYGFDHQGMVSIHASLPPLEGAAVLKSLARAEDEIYTDAQSALDGIGINPPTYGARAEDPTSRSAMQLRADALCLMAKKHLSAEPMDVKTSDRYQVVVHVDTTTLSQSLNSNAQPHTVCHIENGPSIAASTARRLADDCSVVPIFMQHGEPLSIGRKSRIWSSAITRAITTRDQHCQFPGCSSARHTHIHHIQHWANGGDTSVDNGVLLCGFHHRLVHEENYSIEKTTLDEDGNLPRRTVAVDNGAGGTLSLSAPQNRFRVRRADGSEV